MDIKNSRMLKKVIIILVVIMLAEFTIPIFNNNVYGLGNLVGGVLTKPLGYLFIGLIDGVNFILGLLTEDLEGKNIGINWEQSKWYDITFDYDWLLSVDDIFAGDVPAVDANIFKVNNVAKGLNDVVNDVRGAAYIRHLKKAVAGIYVALRNMAAIILLCLLIYTGIRIILASNSYKEQSQWRFMLIDWVKALCLLIFLHVLMAGLFWISDAIVEGLRELGSTSGLGVAGSDSIVESIRRGYADASILSGAMPFIIYIIMYGYATYLTVVFFIAYFKRLVWTAILILISPFICVAYALGNSTKKIFSKWLREYVLNVLIQPYHCLVYTILFLLPIKVMSAAGTELPWGQTLLSPIDMITYGYALLSISMIRPSEKWIRKLFDMNGDVANQASFESGKQTMDQIKAVFDKVKESLEKVVTVVAGGAAIAATGGAAAPAMAAGATANTTALAANAANAAPEAASLLEGSEGLTNMTGGINPGDGMGTDLMNLGGDGMGQNVYGEEFDPYYDDYSESPFEDNFDNNHLKNPVWDDYKDDWVEAEELTDGKPEELKENIEAEHKNDPSAEHKDSLGGSNSDVIQAIESAKNEIVGAINNEQKGKGLAIDGENGIVNMANGIVENDGEVESPLDALNIGEGTGEENGETEKLNGSNGFSLHSLLANSATMKQIGLSGLINKDAEMSGKLKERFVNSAPLQAVKSAYGEAKEKIGDSKVGQIGKAVYQDAKAVKGFIDTPDVKNSLNELGASMHGLVDTMYMPGDASHDWKPAYEERKKNITDSDKKNFEAFVSNKDNINYIMQMNGDKAMIANIKDPVEKKKAEKEAKAEAKEFLNKGEPYLKYGINNVEVVASLIQKQKENGTTPEQTIRDNIKPISNEINVKQQAFPQIQQIIAKETGKPVNSTAVLNQTQNVINQASSYIQNGNSDPQVLARLVQLENNLKSGKFTQIASNPGKVMDIDKVIQKAVKDNMSKINLPNSNSNKEIKALNDFMNNAIQKEMSKLQKNVPNSKNVTSNVTNVTNVTNKKDVTNVNKATNVTKNVTNVQNVNKAINAPNEKSKNIDTSKKPKI